MCQKMVPAALHGLYADSRHERSRPPLRRYIDLGEHDVSLLTRILSNSPPYDLISTSPRHEAYAKITLELIRALPAALKTPPPNKHLFGLFTSDNNQCWAPDPRRRDGRPFKEFCSLHSRLQRPLIHSILRFVFDEIAFHMPKLFDLPFDANQRALFDQLIDVTSLYMRPLDFEYRWGRSPHRKWQRQRNKCAACILTRAGSDADVLVALGAVYRARVREESYDFQLRTLWYDEWIRALDANDAEYLVEKSHALGSAMNRIVRDVRMEAEMVDEIDPNASWTKKKPVGTQPLLPPKSIENQQPNFSNAENHVNIPERVLKSSQLSDKEASAKLSRTWASPQVAKSNSSVRSVVGSVNPESGFSSDSCSNIPVDDDCMTADQIPGAEKVQADCINFHQATYVPNPKPEQLQSTHGSILEATPRTSTSADGEAPSGPLRNPKCGTIFLDNSASGCFETNSRESAVLPDWVDICAYMNKTPSLPDDVPELSESGTIPSSRASSSKDRSTGVSANEASRYTRIVEDDDFDGNDYQNQPTMPLQTFFSPGTLPEGTLPDGFKQSPAQGLHPQPSMATMSSGSVYSFYEGPHREQYNTSVSSMPKPLHIRKISGKASRQEIRSRYESMDLPPPPSSPQSKSKVKKRPTRRPLASIANTCQRIDSDLSSARGSSGSRSTQKRPSTPSIRRSGMTIGGSEFRRMLNTEEDEDDYVDSQRSTWMREFEWEQPHPATSRVFY